MPATYGAMVGIAASQAAVASAEASRAHVERCKSTMPNFDAKKASVSEMRDYSECVNTVYPAEMSGTDIFGAKVLFVIALVGMAAGVVRSLKESWNGFTDHIFFGIMGFVLAPIGVISIAGLLYGIYWVLT